MDPGFVPEAWSAAQKVADVLLVAVRNLESHQDKTSSWRITSSRSVKTSSSTARPDIAWCRTHLHASCTPSPKPATMKQCNMQRGVYRIPCFQQ